jgi:hypothetical protein
MTKTQQIDWTNVAETAKHLAGNWMDFDCFIWSRAKDLEDPDNWCIWYTSQRDAGLLAQSNEQAINQRLKPFSESDNPDVVFESHTHWAVGHIDGFSMRVFKIDRSITQAFEEFCRIQEALEEYPILDEQDYGDREYQATLESYRYEMGSVRDLPEGWESQVYDHFSEKGQDEFFENRDDQGGWAPREAILAALQELGLLPTVVVTTNKPN